MTFKYLGSIDDFGIVLLYSEDNNKFYVNLGPGILSHTFTEFSFTRDDARKIIEILQKKLEEKEDKEK